MAPLAQASSARSLSANSNAYVRTMFHVKHEGWRHAELQPGVVLDDVARVRLERFEQILGERAIRAGMIARSDALRIHERHLLDSLRASPFLPASGLLCDMGSGAGLPGIVLAIARPELRAVLVEVRRNRASFLQEVVAELGLVDVEVYPRRLETFREKADVCTARAFGSPSASWAAASRLLHPSGSLIYWAGVTFDATADLPDGVGSTHFESAGLARSGPLVIMAR